MVSVNRSLHRCGARPIGCRGGLRVERLHRRRARKPVMPRTDRLFFSCGGTQHMRRSLAGDWLAGVAMLLAAASWGVLAAFLAG